MTGDIGYSLCKMNIKVIEFALNLLTLQYLQPQANELSIQFLKYEKVIFVHQEKKKFTKKKGNIQILNGIIE